MPPTLVNKATATGEASATMDFNKSDFPALANGDTMIVMICEYSGPATVLTGPSGWTIAQVRDTTGPDRTVVYGWKYITNASSEPATWTFTSTISLQKAGVMSQWTGVEQNDPLDVAVGDLATTNLTNPDHPDVTTNTDGDLVLAVMGIVDSLAGTATTWGVPSGTTLVDDASVGGNNRAEICVAYKVQATAGGTAIGVWSNTPVVNDDATLITVALKAGAAASGGGSGRRNVGGGLELRSGAS